MEIIENCEKFDISNPEINIIRKNIRNLLKDKKGTLTALAELLGCKQPTISGYLKEDNKEFFHVADLILIAKYFHVSLDSLFAGIDTETKPDKEVTLADVFQNLFELERLTDIHIERIPSALLGKSTEIGIYFKNETVRKYLKEWMQLENMELEPEMKEHMIELWKTDLIEKGKYITKESGFSESESKE